MIPHRAALTLICLLSVIACSCVALASSAVLTVVRRRPLPIVAEPVAGTVACPVGYVCLPEKR